jgi:hypothetical protein
MKRRTIALTVTLFSITIAAVLFETTSTAQTGRSYLRTDDPELAKTIRRLTDRSTAGLVEKRHNNGTVALNIAGRMQEVPLAKLDADGDPVVGCVSSVAEANHFFGRDLETGEVITGKEAEDAENLGMKRAMRSLMTLEEYQTYKSMIEAAASTGSALGTAQVTIVNADGAGEGFNDTTPVSPEGGNPGTTRGEQRLNLFNQAAQIWSAFLDSRVNIQVRSQFNSLTPCSSGGGVLGSAGANQIFRGFPGAEFSDTWYSAALANKVSGVDNSDGANGHDINATFNSDVDNGCLGTGTRFYYGLDNATPAGRVNLLIVLLHEMGHGLGFQTFVNTATGANASGFTDIYSRHIFDQTLELPWNQMTDAQRQASTIGGNLFWQGDSTNPASGYLTNGRDSATGRVRLYAPNPREAGSSVSHWDKTAFPNLLMEPSITVGLPLDLDLTRQQMADIGWYRDQNNDGVQDTITNVNVGGALLVPGTTANLTWTNNGGFNRNVIVELSTDGGTTFPTVLASNIANTGSFNMTVPQVATVLGRVRVREFNFSAPSGMSLADFTIGIGGTTPTPTPSPTTTPTPALVPEIVVETASGNLLQNGVGVAYFGFAQPGITAGSQSFTVRNIGTANLLIGAVTSNGTNPTDFLVNATGFNPMLGPGSATTFSVTFTPGAIGGRSAIIRFSNNDSDENPFEINVNGLGAPPLTPTPTPIFVPIPTPTPTPTPTPSPTPAQRPVLYDFDGDRRADASVFRPGTGIWYLNRSRDGAYAQQFGAPEDRIVPADYDGDKRTDIAIFRPSTGVWFIANSSNGTYGGGAWGDSTDIPTPGDFDGDGQADIAIFRPATGQWWLKQSSAGTAVVQYGALGDVPKVGDYDGDGTADLAVFRPSTGIWYIRRSTAGDIAIQFGDASDRLVPADYDGDGSTDVGVFRPSVGVWYIASVADSTYTTGQFGFGTDTPVPADYDGDGRSDMAIFRPTDGNWWVNGTNSGVFVIGWGQGGDTPAPSAFVLTE